MSTVTKDTKIKQHLGNIRVLPVGTLLERHPLSTPFPNLSEDQAKNLRSSLQTHGQQNPIVLLGDQIIDGKELYMQLIGLNQSLLVADYIGDDAAGYVVAQNLCRRDMTERQRLMATARLTNLKQGKPKAGAKQVNLSLSLKKAAELTEFSETTIKSVKKIIASKNNELIQAVESGKISVDMGLNLIGKPKNQIEAVLASNNPKKTFSELFPPPPKPGNSNGNDPNAGNGAADDASSPSEDDATQSQNEASTEQEEADALFARVLAECQKLQDAQQKRFRDLMQKFLSQGLPATAEVD